MAICHIAWSATECPGFTIILYVIAASTGLYAEVDHEGLINYVILCYLELLHNIKNILGDMYLTSMYKPHTMY